MSDLASIVAEGLTWGMATFLVASGLTLVFGILHILNFAHGGFFAVGAYLAFTAVGALGGDLSLWAYGGVSLMAAIGVALLGLLTDATVFRRLRGVPDAYVLIATYALLLLVNGGVKLVWGLDPAAVPPPQALAGAVVLGDTILPTYDLFIIGCGVVVFAGLDVLLRRTRFGQLMAAVGMDPWAARLLGVDVGRVYTITLMIGFGLAGLAGGLLAANQSLQPGMGDAVIIQAFGVIIVGGTGSVRGAFAAAVLLGLVQAAGNAFVPQYPGVFFFVGLGAMLLLLPDGMAGRERVA